MIIVIGAGVAGLSCALAAAAAGAEVALVVPGRLRPSFEDSAAGLGGSAAGLGCAGGSTVLAQGGIAAAIGADDSPEQHLADTVAAGVGLVDAEAAGVLVDEGARIVRGLLREGFAADLDAAGRPALGLEAAHGRARIVHAGGDRTGAVLHAHLATRVLADAEAGRIELIENRTAVELTSDSGVVRGAVLRSLSGDSALESRHADAVVLAMGGYAAFYERSTNPTSSRGDGVVLAARAGAVVSDLEFVQFHPTVLHGSGLLISEAVRGAGAVLRDGSGSRFMAGRHPLAELAPRDVVSREMQRAMRMRGESRLWLDATGIEREGGPGSLAARFPGITAALAEHGLDWTREPIPVSPAAHYTMGGVAADLRGRSTVPGLFVAGETASTGVHGANRLASNSLLEGLVFGRRAGLAAAAFAEKRGDWKLDGHGMRELVSTAVPGVIAADRGTSPLGDMIALAAAARAESRGAHQRDDAPQTDPAQARRRGFALAFAAPSTTEPAQQRSLAQC
ncbi:L-aspartate oxidase [Leucobacter tenebrionis]|uniref:L-aspartate oxidase n=1 Tax=Leucobacter tenebrionis TaxID=2873270 RepID=UPI001CA73B0F|nr:FAD-binding protein [Leucobacter tenebrionis]QZY51545.1 FAD-dependent oxidoreductase [Leucobacter tenebrionis]